jgi:hypothetical protein
LVDFYDNVTLHFAEIDDFAAFHGFGLTSSWQADVKPPNLGVAGTRSRLLKRDD